MFISDNYISKTFLEEAHDRIRPYIHKTPVLESNYINKIMSAHVFFKCENFQKTGSFKIRGVMNSLLSLNEQKKLHGVAAHSSGNHAQALAYGANVMQCAAYLIMPKNSNKKKVDAVREYGGYIHFCEPNDDARSDMLDKVVLETDAQIIHAYDSLRTIIGQSTAAKELIEELNPPLDIIITPVGGGGLLAGTALSAREFTKKTKVYGAEPELACDAFLSFSAGHIIYKDNRHTVADGLRTNLGDLNFEIIQKEIEQIILVSEEEIRAAMGLVWERMKIIIEPSSAVPLAAMMKSKELFSGKRIGVILSGGNVDLSDNPLLPTYTPYA